MKKASEMTLDELLELENNNPVLSFTEFSKTKGYFIASLLVMIKKCSGITPYCLLKNHYERYRKNNPIHIELHRLYNQLLKDLLVEINQLSFQKDPLSISILIGDYLIPSGILSYTKQFYRTHSDKLFLSNNPEFDTSNLLHGLYVVSGYGCCRHVNSFIYDFLTTMNVKSDRILCMQDTIENLESRKKENNLVLNHLVIGYIQNKKYHLIDSFNHNYSLIKLGDVFYISNAEKDLIPYFHSNSFQKKIHWHDKLEYHSFTQNEIDFKKEQIIEILRNGGMERFQQFKQAHFELLEKIAYLTPIELERNLVKEKLKEYRN